MERYSKQNNWKHNQGVYLGTLDNKVWICTKIGTHPLNQTIDINIFVFRWQEKLTTHRAHNVGLATEWKKDRRMGNSEVFEDAVPVTSG